MAFPGDWNRRGKITIQSGQVDADLTDFPVYVDLSDLPADFWDNVQSDGGDIRVSKDESGTDQMPAELVSIDTTAETGELHVKYEGTLSSTADSDFYIWYDSVNSETFPSDSATNGAQNVWDANHQIVWHMNEASGTTSLDSTSNNRDGSIHSSVTLDQSGQVGNSFLMDPQSFSSTNRGVELPNETGVGGESAFTFSCWVQQDAQRNDVAEGAILDKGIDASAREYKFYEWNGQWNIIVRGDDTGNEFSINNVGSADLDVWQWMVARWDGSTLEILEDATSIGTTSFTESRIWPGADPLLVGDVVGRGQEFQGFMDEYRHQDVARSDGWLTTEYNNQNSPSTFYATSSFGAVSTATTVSGTVQAQDATTTGSIDAVASVSGAVQAQASTTTGEVDAVPSVSGSVDAQSATTTGTLLSVESVSGDVSSGPSSAAGQVQPVASASGAVLAQDATASGTINAVASASGSTQTQDATSAGQVDAVSSLAGGVQAQQAIASGTLQAELSVSGAVASQGATTQGTIDAVAKASGAVSAQQSTTSGVLDTGTSVTGGVQAQGATVSGSVDVSASASGSVQAQNAVSSGAIDAQPSISGSVQAQSSQADGDITAQVAALPEGEILVIKEDSDTLTIQEKSDTLTIKDPANA